LEISLVGIRLLQAAKLQRNVQRGCGRVEGHGVASADARSESSFEFFGLRTEADPTRAEDMGDYLFLAFVIVGPKDQDHFALCDVVTWNDNDRRASSSTRMSRTGARARFVDAIAPEDVALIREIR
jgi:hypothetical protein